MNAPSWGLPHDASVYGWRIDWLMATTTLFVAVMFAITVVWLLSACLLHGRRHPALYDLGQGRSTVIKALVLSAVIFLVVDGNLFVNGMTDLNQAFWAFDKAEAAGNAVRVQVNAHQWAWDFRQPGADGKFNTPDDVITLNELRIPEGRPVILQLAATDVVHSFSLPNFRVKQDAVPGMVTRMWFQAKETGLFDIACAQHCGVHHYKMRGKLDVMTARAYDAWLAEASLLATRAHDPADRGAAWGWDWERHTK